MRGCTGPVFSCEKYCIFTAEEDPWIETSCIVWGFCYVIKALLAYCLVLYNVTMILYSINYTCLSCGHGGCDLVRFCVFQFSDGLERFIRSELGGLLLDWQRLQRKWNHLSLKEAGLFVVQC